MNSFKKINTWNSKPQSKCPCSKCIGCKPYGYPRGIFVQIHLAMAKSDPRLLECKCVFSSVLNIVIFSNGGIFSPKVELKYFISPFPFLPTFVAFYPPFCLVSLVLSFHPHAISHGPLHASVVLLSLSWLKKKNKASCKLGYCHRITRVRLSRRRQSDPEWVCHYRPWSILSVDHQGQYALAHSPLNPGTMRGWRSRGLSPWSRPVFHSAGKLG